MAGVKGKSGGPRKNSGGARPGSGRPSRAAEENVIGHLKRALDLSPGGAEAALNEIWGKVIERSRQGSIHHTTIFFNYYYGKPKENLDQPTQLMITVVRK